MDNLAARVHDAVAAVCPILGVRIGSKADKDTWQIQFADEATAAQRTAAANALAGFDPHAPTQADYERAIQLHIDTTAASKGYGSGASCAGYSASTVSAWVAEATAFIAWRDEVWVYVFAQQAAVLKGERAQPSIADLIAELPAIEWP